MTWEMFFFKNHVSIGAGRPAPDLFFVLYEVKQVVSNLGSIYFGSP